MEGVTAAAAVAEAAAAVTKNSGERFILQWHITDRCTRSCRHCYQEKTPAPELPFHRQREIIEQFKEFLVLRAEKMGGTFQRGHINLTGGEPFCRDDLYDLLETFQKNKTFFSFALLSNGSALDAQTTGRLKQRGPEFVQLSLDGPQEIHDQLRGTGAYAETLRALKALARGGIKTYLSFTAHKENYRSFPQVAALARRFRAAKVWADRFVPFGQGRDMREKALTPSETMDFIKIMDQERKRTLLNRLSGTEISMNRSLQFFGTRRRPYHCSAAASLLAIMPDGTVYPCRRLPLPAGNLLETSLTVLYHNSDLLRMIRQAGAAPKGCESCRCLAYCQGGSRCLAYALTGDWHSGDPGCVLQRSPLHQEASGE
jgi:radical SAM protein with 4Fe4S-binding SPASM domain